MVYHQIVTPPPTVEDTTDDVAVTPYNRPESAFNFAAWPEAPQREPLQLLPLSPLSRATAPTADSSPQAVIHSIPLQLQPQHCKGKGPTQSKELTPSNPELQGLQAQLQQL